MAPETDQAARRDDEIQVHPAAPLVHQVDQPPLPRREFLGKHPDEHLGDVDEEALNRFEHLLALKPRDHVGLGNHKLVPLPAHRLDQDRHLQLPAPAHLEGVGPFRRLHPERNVPEDLSLQPVPDMAGGEVLPLPAGHRAVVHEKEHRHGRLVHTDSRQRLRILQGGDGIADLEIFHAGEGNDVARLDPLHRNLFQPHEGVEGGELDPRSDRLFAAEAVGLAHLQDAVHQAADGELAHVGVIVEVRDEILRHGQIIPLRTWNCRQDRIEERREIRRAVPELPVGDTAFGIRVEDRKLDLLLRRIEVDEEVVHLVDHHLDPRIGAVDLVDDEDDGNLPGKGLLQHEARLRQRAFARIDQQHHPVHHVQAPLDLPAEIGVARRVHDVDLHLPVADGRVLGHDRDAPLLFEIHRIHHAILDDLVVVEGSRLPEHPVHEGRLAVVHVGNDSNITDIRFTHVLVFQSF